jgi:hypothetical protein
VTEEHSTWREGRIEDLLARIATALEQMALDGWSQGRSPIPVPRNEEPPLPTPPNLPVTPIMQPLPPVQAAPFQFTGPSASCPTHHVPWKTVPAGTSKRTGQAYSAFLACPEMGCKQRPPQ